MLQFFIITSLLVTSYNTLQPQLPEAVLRTDEIIRDNGYPVEVHRVQTGDGYILTMFRIPHGKGDSSKTSPNRKLFFVQHGLVGSSSNFVTSRQIKCLAFLLADKGYDVWLGNTRGNRYSTNHAFLDPERKYFWDFSFDDMQFYDIPAMINYALKISNQSNLYYVGHSQGTLLSFAALSENKELRHKVKGLFAMAPVARLKNIDRRVKIAASIFYGLKWVVNELNITKLYPGLDSMKTIAKLLCPFSKYLCDSFLRLSVVYENKYHDEIGSASYLSNLPEGTSIKNIYHFCQLISSGLFQKYDYGWFGNLINYHSRSAPLYDLKKLDIPVTLFSGTKDIFAVKEDVDWLAGQLPRVLHNIVVDGYDHIDFYWSKTAKSAVYDKIIHIVENEIEH